ncbi:MAG TPA: CBS domain-containing protein [Acetobacteraceae bacterium]|nr:CBS domain-containing protein [Acetobacteraceae bacterium]
MAATDTGIRQAAGIPPAPALPSRASRPTSGASRAIVAYPDEFLDAVIERMTRANVAHLPIVAREDRKLNGYIGWKDLLSVRTRAHAEEHERAILLPRLASQVGT